MTTEMIAFEWNPDGMDRQHMTGDLHCYACFKEPDECSRCLSGLVHNEFGDENSDGDYWLYTKCDNCGEDV